MDLRERKGDYEALLYGFHGCGGIVLFGDNLLKEAHSVNTLRRCVG